MSAMWKQTLARYDVEVYKGGRWVMYDWTAEVVASGLHRRRVLRFAAITWAYLRRWRADRTTTATGDQHG